MNWINDEANGKTKDNGLSEGYPQIEAGDIARDKPKTDDEDREYMTFK